MKNKDKMVLLSILDTIEEIQLYCVEQKCENKKAFLDNAMLKRAVSMCMISISEIIVMFSDEFKAEYPQVNTTQFKTIRNIAAHRYGAINFGILWDTVTLELPKLKVQVEEILKSNE